MAECNYSKEGLERSIQAGYIPIERVPRLIKSHMSLDHLLDMLHANDLRNVRQIYLLHLSEANSEEDRFRREVQCLTGAEVYICWCKAETTADENRATISRKGPDRKGGGDRVKCQGNQNRVLTSPVGR